MTMEWKCVRGKTNIGLEQESHKDWVCALSAVAQNGSFEWSYLQAGGIVFSPTIGSGSVIYVGSYDGKIVL
jgi:hypothetical protein